MLPTEHNENSICLRGILASSLLARTDFTAPAAVGKTRRADAHRQLLR